MDALRMILLILAAIIMFPIALLLAILLLYVLFCLLICILCGVTELIYGLVTAPLKFLKSGQKDRDRLQ